jgi:hypothetical protein
MITLPDGQITGIARIPVQPLSEKYFASGFQKYVVSFAHPVPPRGALAIVMNVGMGCGGRGSVGRDDSAGRANSL